MRIVINTEQLPAALHWDENNPVRGTEKFYVYTARCLRQTGHQVDIIKDPDRRPSGRSYDIAIVANRRSTADQPIKAKRFIHWSNYYFDNPKWYAGPFSMESGADNVVISQFAKEMVPSRFNARVVPHGIDRDIYFPGSGHPRQKAVAFTSSPDRGLARLQAIWDEFDIENATGYRLVTGKYGKNSISDREMAEMLRNSQFWVHPGVGNELFCLAAVEAQACGCTPIVVPSGALRETVLHGYRFTHESFAEGLYSVLSGEATIQNITANHIPTWETSTEMLINPK